MRLKQFCKKSNFHHTIYIYNFADNLIANDMVILFYL